MKSFQQELANATWEWCFKGVFHLYMPPVCSLGMCSSL